MAAGTREGKGGDSARLSNHRRFGIAARRMLADSPLVRAGRNAPARLRQHPIVFANTAGFIAFVGLVVTLLIRHNDFSAATDWEIVAWGAVVALAGTIGPSLRWLRTWVVIDDERVVWRTGLLRGQHVAMDLDGVRGLGLEQSWLGRRLGYGELRIVDQAGSVHSFGPVGSVERLRTAAGRGGRRRGRRDG